MLTLDACPAEAHLGSEPFQSQPHSPLLSLPSEIRLEVYYHILILPASIPKTIRTLAGRNHLSSYLLPTPKGPIDAPLHPQILRTCRQCFVEGTPILYTLNTFIAHPTLLTGLPSLPPLARPITAPRVLAMIKKWHIQVRLDTDPRFSGEAVTAAFTGAEELDVECWQAMYGAADPGPVLGRFAGVKGVKKCSVKGSIGAEWKDRMVKSMCRSEGKDWEWGVIEREMSGGGVSYELWTHGGR